MQDYGRPFSLRPMTRHLERVSVLIFQNANVCNADVALLFNEVVLRLWIGHTPETEAKVPELFVFPVTQTQYLEGIAESALVSPGAWMYAQ